MRPFMDKESYWMLVDDDLHEEDDGDDVTTHVETFSANVCVTSVGGGHTLRMKSGGVPGLTVGLKTPSW